VYLIGGHGTIRRATVRELPVHRPAQRRDPDRQRPRPDDHRATRSSGSPTTRRTVGGRHADPLQSQSAYNVTFSGNILMLNDQPMQLQDTNHDWLIENNLIVGTHGPGFGFGHFWGTPELDIGVTNMVFRRNTVWDVGTDSAATPRACGVAAAPTTRSREPAPTPGRRRPAAWDTPVGVGDGYQFSSGRQQPHRRAVDRREPAGRDRPRPRVPGDGLRSRRRALRRPAELGAGRCGARRTRVAAMTLTLPAQTLQDDCDRAGPALGISSSSVPWSTLNDIIGSSNLLKLLSGQIGATHAFETAVLTLDRGPDCSLGALVAVLPDVGSAFTLVLRQHPSRQLGLRRLSRRGAPHRRGHLDVGDCAPRPAAGPGDARRARDGRARRSRPGAGSALRRTGDEIGAWFVAAADVTTDGSSVTFDNADAALVVDRVDATYSAAGTYALALDDTTVRLDCITGSGTVVLPDPPTNIVAPKVVGTRQTGSVLTCGTGTWASTVDAYAYAWARDAAPIGGATASTYTLQAADEGTMITCVVTASNAGGSGTATSNAIAATANTAGMVWDLESAEWTPRFVLLEDPA
jgi:hypothetical protein